MEASKTRETVLRGASSGLRNVWTPSRLRKSVEWDLDRCWRPPSLMDVWLFLTERRELQTAVQLSQDIREEKKSPSESSEDSSVHAAHVSSNSLPEPLCFRPQESSWSLTWNAHTLT